MVDVLIDAARLVGVLAGFVVLVVIVGALVMALSVVLQAFAEQTTKEARPYVVASCVVFAVVASAVYATDALGVDCDPSMERGTLRCASKYGGIGDPSTTNGPLRCGGRADDTPGHHYFALRNRAFDHERLRPDGLWHAPTVPCGTRAWVCFRGRCAVGTREDVGPAVWTGRSVDLGAPLAKAIGFEDPDGDNLIRFRLLRDDQVVRLVRVIDGDTIVVRKGKHRFRVRVASIESPELRGDECGAKEARDVLRRILYRPGLRLRLRFDPPVTDHDSRGRTVAVVVRILGNYNAGLGMVRLGFAKPWFYNGEIPTNHDAYRERADLAVERGVGVWGLCPVSSYDPPSYASAWETHG